MKDTKALLQLFRAIGGLGWQLSGLLSLRFLENILEGFGLFLLVPFFDILLSENGADRWSDSELLGQFTRVLSVFPEEQHLAVVATLIVGSLLLKNITQYLGAVGWTKYDAAVNIRVQKKMINNLLADRDQVDRRTRGQIVNTFENQVWIAVDTLLAALEALVEVFAVLFLFTLLFLLSWQMTLAALVAIALISVFIYAVSLRIKVLGEAVVEAQERMSSIVLDIVSGLKTIKLYNWQRAIGERFNRGVEHTVMTGLRQERLSAIVAPTTEIVALLLLVTLVAVSFLTEAAPMALVLGFVVILQRIIPRLNKLIDVRIRVASDMASVHNVLPLLDAVPQSSGRRPFGGLETDLEIRDLHFQYPVTGDAILKGLTLTIPRGEVTGIAGPSGAGKSTLVDLLCRTATPQLGSITANGNDIREYDLNAWRAAIGVVLQDIHLFDDTIAGNIALDKVEADRAHVEEAAKRAGAHDFISALPNGYDTKLTDSGSILSGGQKQRISLARALLREPSLLILDEPTSALDPLSETLVAQALKTRPEGCTVILISHRASTLRTASKVVVLRDGQLAHDGFRIEQFDDEDSLARILGA
jgi:subfamily B ATP-binding cassette protein MsbA